MKLALAWTQDMMWELIQPLEGPSIYWEFLRDHGEGIHHVMVDYGERPLADCTAEFAARGWEPIMEGNYLGSQFVYYGTEGSLATTIEVRYSAPGWQRPKPDRWYPAPP
jgi:methylmalonyl-CoA/ethylmalonyl-CoA epimerase